MNSRFYLTLFALLFFFVTLPQVVGGEDSVVAMGDPLACKLVIEPSSTKLSIAKADLVVGALKHDDASYQGIYAITVSPFTFKNDHGKLVLNAPSENVLRLARGETMEFIGKATSDRDGKIKGIKGKASPVTKDRGSVKFTVNTEDGDLVFNSTYRIVPQKEKTALR